MTHHVRLNLLLMMRLAKIPTISSFVWDLMYRTQSTAQHVANDICCHEGVVCWVNNGEQTAGGELCQSGDCKCHKGIVFMRKTVKNWFGVWNSWNIIDKSKQLSQLTFSCQVQAEPYLSMKGRQLGSKKSGQTEVTKLLWLDTRTSKLSSRNKASLPH